MDDEATKRPCPECGHLISKNAKFCPHCGKTLKNVVCPHCGRKNEPSAKFCEKCGSALDLPADKLEMKEEPSQTEEKEAEQEESTDSSEIEIPSALTLMPGEKVLARHGDYYVSNKRLIKHYDGFLGSKTKDYAYDHIKGIEEVSHIRGTLLWAGIILLLVGLLFYILKPETIWISYVGVFAIIAAIMFKTVNIKVDHMDGKKVLVENTDNESGKRFLTILRGQLYKK